MYHEEVLKAVKQFSETGTCRNSTHLIEVLKKYYISKNRRLNVYCKNCVREAMSDFTAFYLENNSVKEEKSFKDVEAVEVEKEAEAVEVETAPENEAEVETKPEENVLILKRKYNKRPKD